MNKANLSIIIIIILLLSQVHSYSKSLSLLIPYGSDTTIIANPNEEFVKFIHKIQNNGLASINVKTMVKVIEITEGHLYSFCDLNQCYPFTNQDFEPSLPFSLGGLEATDDYFYIEIKTNDIAGKTILHITFYNEADISDSVGYTLTFDVATSIAEISLPMEISIFPNPVKEILLFDLSNLPSELKSLRIYNYTGAIIFSNEKIAHSSLIQLRVDNLSQGLYFYELKTKNGSRFNGKFIISR